MPWTVTGYQTSILLLLLQDFANMPIDEIRLNIASRRDKIFLLMEELRRLRIQQRLKVWGDVQALVGQLISSRNEPTLAKEAAECTCSTTGTCLPCTASCGSAS